MRHAKYGDCCPPILIIHAPLLTHGLFAAPALTPDSIELVLPPAGRVLSLGTSQYAAQGGQRNDGIWGPEMTTDWTPKLPASAPQPHLPLPRAPEPNPKIRVNPHRLSFASVFGHMLT